MSQTISKPPTTNKARKPNITIGKITTSSASIAPQSSNETTTSIPIQPSNEKKSNNNSTPIPATASTSTTASTLESSQNTGYYVDEQHNRWVWDTSTNQWIFDKQQTRPTYSQFDQQFPDENVPFEQDQPQPEYVPDHNDDINSEPKKPPSNNQDPNKKKRKKKKNQWDHSAANPNIFVSGLPEDITTEEIVQHFTKYAGVIKKDPETGEYKVKMYEDKATGKFKGEARIGFLVPESVNQAIYLLDDFEIRPGCKLQVKQAIFEQKGKFVSKKKSKRSKELSKKINQDKELSWNDEGRVHVILKYMFDPAEGLNDPNFFEELREDVRSECAKLGTITSLTIFENNPDGIIAVKFGLPLSAERCISTMNGRWFGGRQIVAEYYDGVTNYAVRENSEQEAQRLSQWDEWINNSKGNPNEEDDNDE